MIFLTYKFQSWSQPRTLHILAIMHSTVTISDPSGTMPYPITWGDNSMPLLGVGRFGCVVRLGKDRVLKKPKTFAEVDDPDAAYTNEANINFCLL